MWINSQRFDNRGDIITIHDILDDLSGTFYKRLFKKIKENCKEKEIKIKKKCLKKLFLKWNNLLLFLQLIEISIDDFMNMYLVLIKEIYKPCPKELIKKMKEQKFLLDHFKSLSVENKREIIVNITVVVCKKVKKIVL